jgi:hypothetical protein
VAVDNAARLKNQARLRDLARDHASEVKIFSAHCPTELDRFAAVGPSVAKTNGVAHVTAS